MEVLEGRQSVSAALRARQRKFNVILLRHGTHEDSVQEILQLASDLNVPVRYADARELARRVTAWSLSLPVTSARYVVCSGGGGGIMEAANRGASDAGGRTIGLNIGLPHEQRPNRYVTSELMFEFHYFFMRKLWFAHLARALVVFPGGFGTLDEMMEILTLAQTGKLARPVPVILYGESYWREIVDFDALVRHGMIGRDDLSLFRFADDPATALTLLQQGITSEPDDAKAPAFAHSRKPPRD